MTLAIGPLQIVIFLLIIPLVVFLIGFWLGKRLGYKKRVKEEENIK